MRYKVFYGSASYDYAVCYAGSPAEALEQYKQRTWRPDSTAYRVEEYPEPPEPAPLLELAKRTDEHEFLLDLIQAIQDSGLEARISTILTEDYGYKD